MGIPYTFKYVFTRENEGRPNSGAISIISCQALACILASYIFRPYPRGGLPPKVSRLSFLSPHIPETKANFPRSVGPFPSLPPGDHTTSKFQPPSFRCTKATTRLSPFPPLSISLSKACWWFKMWGNVLCTFFLKKAK